MQIGRHEGRGVDQAKARHAQHAVHEVADVVPAQIVPDEALVGGLAGREIVRGGRDGGIRRVRPGRRSGNYSRTVAIALLSDRRGSSHPLPQRCILSDRNKYNHEPAI